MSNDKDQWRSTEMALLQKQARGSRPCFMAEGSSAAPYAVVVDDNPVILLHVADILEDAGFSVFTAGGSNEALDLVLKHAGSVTVLFTNVEIPGPLNGFRLARYVADRWPSTAILVSSGRFVPNHGDMPSEAVFVPKPFTDGQVIAEVRRLLLARNISEVQDNAVSAL